MEVETILRRLCKRFTMARRSGGSGGTVMLQGRWGWINRHQGHWESLGSEATGTSPLGRSAIEGLQQRSESGTLHFGRTALLALWVKMCCVEREFLKKPKTRCYTVWVRDGQEPRLWGWLEEKPKKYTDRRWYLVGYGCWWRGRSWEHSSCFCCRSLLEWWCSQPW